MDWLRRIIVYFLIICDLLVLKLASEDESNHSVEIYSSSSHLKSYTDDTSGSIFDFLSEQNLDEHNSDSAMKSAISQTIADTLSRFLVFKKRFEVSRLSVHTAVSYSNEIAKGTAFSPLFNFDDEVEDTIVVALVKALLPSCDFGNLTAAAWIIGDVISDFIIHGDYLESTVTERVLNTYAGGIVGSVVWRLSKLPDADINLADFSEEEAKIYSTFVCALSSRLVASPVFQSACTDTGIDEEFAQPIVRAICGSTFLGFNLRLVPHLIEEISGAYMLATDVLPDSLDPYTRSLIASSVLSEAVGLLMLQVGYLNVSWSSDKLDDVCSDVTKILVAGITTNILGIWRPRTEDTNVLSSIIESDDNNDFTSFATDVEEVLLDSLVFHALFEVSEASIDTIEAYADSMANGATDSLVLDSNMNISENLADALKKAILTAIVIPEENITGVDRVSHFASAIANALVGFVTINGYVDMENDSEVVTDQFRQMALHMLLSLSDDFGSSDSSFSSSIEEATDDVSSYLEKSGSPLIEAEFFASRASFAETLATILSSSETFQSVFGLDEVDSSGALRLIEAMAKALSRSPFLGFNTELAQNLMEAMATAYSSSNVGTILAMDPKEQCYVAASSMAGSIVTFMSVEGFLRQDLSVEESKELASDVSVIFLSAISSRETDSSKTK